MLKARKSTLQNVSRTTEQGAKVAQPTPKPIDAAALRQISGGMAAKPALPRVYWS